MVPLMCPAGWFSTLGSPVIGPKQWYTKMVIRTKQWYIKMVIRTKLWYMKLVIGPNQRDKKRLPFSAPKYCSDNQFLDPLYCSDNQFLDPSYCSDNGGPLSRETF